MAFPADPLGFGAQTWIDELTPAIGDRVVSEVSDMTGDRVFESLYPDDDHLAWPPADRFVTVYGSNFPVDQTDVLGGGSHNTAFDATVVLTVYVRLEADIEGHSVQQLRDEARGVYKLIKEIITALQTWSGPVDSASGLSKFRRPMRVAPGFRVNKKTGKDGRRWAVSPVSFEVSFVSDLGNPYAT